MQFACIIPLSHISQPQHGTGSLHKSQVVNHECRQLQYKNCQPEPTHSSQALKLKCNSHKTTRPSHSLSVIAPKLNIALSCDCDWWTIKPTSQIVLFLFSATAFVPTQCLPCFPHQYELMVRVSTVKSQI